MNDESEPSVDLSQVGQLVKKAQYRNHRAMDAALRPLGTSLVQWDALRAISRFPGASGHDLALATFQSDQSWGTLATRLVSRGLIERSAGVGRRVAHELTDEGRALLADGTAASQNVLPELFAALDEDERTMLATVLRKLTADDQTLEATTPN
ncbi:MarR family winged helix-turn-helix transcriptional regulator [Glaciihabitans sp. dw_435]|uniref:MarR family winged helix-turn-helix transcriptional regulator n=1 Tax=Glaciihabitans sp. dw_435 TaxID=2720081 RepID=UPI001BD3D32A|nr:MarR family transcriptional regulator [Glaciihabitans sp. dw_435]